MTILYCFKETQYTRVGLIPINCFFKEVDGLTLFYKTHTNTYLEFRMAGSTIIDRKESEFPSNTYYELVNSGELKIAW